MDGWSQVTQASQRPSGDGRGAATKSPWSTRGTTDCDPSVGTATSRCPVVDVSTCSSTTPATGPRG